MLKEYWGFDCTKTHVIDYVFFTNTVSFLLYNLLKFTLLKMSLKESLIQLSSNKGIRIISLFMKNWSDIYSYYEKFN